MLKGVVRVAPLARGVLAYNQPCAAKYLSTSNVLSGLDQLPSIQLTIPESRGKVEMSTAEWKYVERLLPSKTIPPHFAQPGEILPSGWVAPSAKVGDHQYFARRNNSHQLQVYVKHIRKEQR
ncbi:unnamed protein product [Meganyctiphanes norvegica]|uniref:Uncharacterized protein n=1 Tax=Meganyctiphanes norvegica TaxID=48144 RepID=A0AAV2R6U4_MEGNR